MNKSKKILLVSFIVFIVVVIFIMIDMSSKTTFPGQNSEPGTAEDSLKQLEMTTPTTEQ
ncbi:MAG: hypothetical protein WBB45_05705 [Cyclobacteriaceae bacterium]